MHRVRVSLGPYGDWLKIRDEDEPDSDPGIADKRIGFTTATKTARRGREGNDTN